MSNKACLVATKVSGWGGEKSSKTLTDNLIQSEGMSRDAAKLVLNLVTPEFRASLKRFDSDINAVKNKWLFPTGATSLFVLPLDAKDSFKAAWEAADTARKDGVRAVLADQYQSQIDLARDRLQSAFRESDYPSLDDIADKFSVKVSFLPFPDSGQVEEEDLKAAVEEARREATHTAHKAAWDRLYGTCRDFVARLHNYHERTANGEKTKYHATIVESMKGLVESLDQMNMFDDPILTESLAVLKTMIAGVAPEMLKHDEAARLIAIKTAQSVIDGAFPVKSMPSPVEPQRVEEDSPVPKEKEVSKEWSTSDLF